MDIKSEGFRDDARVVEAKRLILSALSEHQSELKLRGPDSAHEIDYRELLQQCSEERGGQLCFPYLGSGLGRGPLVELLDGSVKYDFITGIGAHFWGHSHPGILSAAIDGALEDIVLQGNLQQNAISQEVMHNFLLLSSGASLKHCFLTSSGAMANENAFKLALHKKPNADRILAFEHCFAGRTLAMASVTDKAKYRDNLPLALAVDYLPFYNSDRPEKSQKHMLKKLDSLLARYPGKHALMIIELIQGEGGYYPGDRDFFIELLKVLKEHEIAIIFDEVQTFGRTEKPFAYQYFNLEEYAEIVTIGKMSQVCATLYQEKFKPPAGLISQTFTSSSTALYTARYITEEMLAGKFFGADGLNNKMGNQLRFGLQKLAQAHPSWLKGPYGCGAMVACTVGDGSLDVAKAFINELFKQGCLSFIAGGNPVRVRFLPPIPALEEADIQVVLVLIKSTLKALEDEGVLS